MTDRELLEYAAKAAGIDGEFANNGEDAPIFFHEPKTPGIYGSWNPLTDDGDALRLAVKLDLNIFQAHGNAYAMESEGEDNGIATAHYADKYSATRRSIIRAAAEIGRAM
jgi:hypothetical protein